MKDPRVPRKQQIRTKPTVSPVSNKKTKYSLWGWLDGKQTYLCVSGEPNSCCALTGQRLYRLAKAIVRRFEADKQ